MYLKSHFWSKQLPSFLVLNVDHMIQTPEVSMSHIWSLYFKISMINRMTRIMVMTMIDGDDDDNDIQKDDDHEDDDDITFSLCFCILTMHHSMVS